MKPNDLAVARFIDLAEQLNDEQRWSLPPQVLHSYAQQLAECWHDISDADDERLRTAITNFHHDHAVVALLRHGDLAEHSVAWEEWTRRVIGQMRACRSDLYSVDAVASDLDDLVQEALIDLWSGLASFRFESRLRTWAARVIANRMARHYRRVSADKHAPERAMRSLDKLLLSGADVRDEIISRTEERIDADEMTRLVKAVLSQHPDARLQRVFDLHVFKAQTMRAIGQDLQLSPARVHNLLRQATTLLRNDLHKDTPSGLDPAGPSSELYARNRLY